ncbi:MerR family transcriptional regulator [Priestia megaterium]|uniref:hypothetical protein n=1 Tax=Priestia megaterium TaxID=1404 RepID=UPI002E1FC6A8|nr:MerR family transcriptional regulator [Priestia megaterium]
MNLYLQTELARLCEVPESTLRQRIKKFKRYISPVQLNGKTYYTDETYDQMVLIEYAHENKQLEIDIEDELLTIILCHKKLNKIKRMAESLRK